MIVDSFPVTYPYRSITPDQEVIISQALRGLRQALDGRRVISLIEAPTGAGKTLSMLSAVSAFKARYPNSVSKVLFLCRTVNEVNHVLGEAQKLNGALLAEADAAARMAQVTSAAGDATGEAPAARRSSQLLALPLTSRLRFCVNETVISNAAGFASIDGLCHLCTTSLSADIEDMGLEAGPRGPAEAPAIPPCVYYQNTLSTPLSSALPPAAYTIPEFQRACKDRGLCPYFASRSLGEVADIIVCAYNYILDPKFSPAISQYLDDRTVILFDEAHNLESATTDAYSMSLSYSAVESCKRQLLTKLEWAKGKMERQVLRPLRSVASMGGMGAAASAVRAGGQLESAAFRGSPEATGPPSAAGASGYIIDSETLQRSILRNPKAINSVERDANVLFHRSVSLSYLEAFGARGEQGSPGGPEGPVGQEGQGQQRALAPAGFASPGGGLDVEVSPVHFFNALLRFCSYLTAAMLRMARSDSDNLLLHPRQEMVNLMESYGLGRDLLQAAPEILHSYMHSLGFVSMDLAHLAQFASLFAYSTGLGEAQNTNIHLSQLLGESFIFLIERPDVLTQTRGPPQARASQGDGQGVGIFGGTVAPFVHAAVDRQSKGAGQGPEGLTPGEGLEGAPGDVGGAAAAGPTGGVGAAAPGASPAAAASVAAPAAGKDAAAAGAIGASEAARAAGRPGAGGGAQQNSPQGQASAQQQGSRIVSQTSRVFEDGVFSTKPAARTAIYRILCLNSFLALQPILQYFRVIFMMSGTLQLGELSSDGESAYSASPQGGDSQAPLPSQTSPQASPRATHAGRPTTSVFERILGLDYYASLCPAELIPSVHRISVSSSSLERNAYVKYLSKGSDLSRLTTRYLFRSSLSVVQNYARLIQLLANSYSDGMVVFFPSYRYMEDLLLLWQESNLLPSLVGNKLLFLETPDPVETTHAVAAYKIACDLGRGAVFFGVARGKVSEGVDFKGHHGRICLLIGVPYSYSGSPLVQVRLAYLSRQRNVSEREYLQADAGRVASQCVGRVLRGDRDFAAVLLADYRYDELRPYLSGWLRANLSGDEGKKVEVIVQEVKGDLYCKERERLCLEDWRKSENRGKR